MSSDLLGHTATSALEQLDREDVTMLLVLLELDVRALEARFEVQGISPREYNRQRVALDRLVSIFRSAQAQL